MVDYEKENAELKRRIELITSLKVAKSDSQSQKQEVLSEGGSGVMSDSVKDGVMVDSAWSQAQACGSSESS